MKPCIKGWLAVSALWAATMAQAETGSFLGAPPAGEQVLSRQRGGADVSTTAALSGGVKDNSASNVSAGGNVIRDGSFANAVGLPMVVQNSGSNVLIQSAITVNVQFRQP